MIKSCKNCNIELKNKYNIFCSKSCSAKFNNESRGTTSKSYKTLNCMSCNIQCNVLSRASNITCIECKNNKPLYSRIYLNRCQHCHKNRESIQANRKYCKSCNSLYSDAGRVPYYFRFNIYNYPNLFDLSLIEKYGWFSNGKNNSRININGVSRDHKISISESIKNNYDPFYISHPLNCEIMLHSDNIKKNTISSIGYELLCKIVDEYEMVRKKGVEPLKPSV